jgi:hypothetical protein
MHGDIGSSRAVRLDRRNFKGGQGRVARRLGLSRQRGQDYYCQNHPDLPSVSRSWSVFSTPGLIENNVVCVPEAG